MKTGHQSGIPGSAELPQFTPAAALRLLLPRLLLQAPTLGDYRCRITSDMGFAARFGELHLLLALGKPLALSGRQLRKALMTAHPLLVLGPRLISFRNRPATGMTLVIVAAFKTVIYCSSGTSSRYFRMPPLRW